MGLVLVNPIPTRVTQAKQEHNSLENCVLVLESALLQFRTNVPSGTMIK